LGVDKRVVSSEWCVRVRARARLRLRADSPL
jgi:hypothetical protein